MEGGTVGILLFSGLNLRKWFDNERVRISLLMKIFFKNETGSQVKHWAVQSLLIWPVWW